MPEEISRCWTYKLADGTEAVVNKGNANLVADAVPSIFFNVPAYWSKNNRKRKSPAKRMPLSKKVKDTCSAKKMLLSKKIKVEEPEDTDAVENIMPQFPVTTLIENLCNIRKPNKFWSVSSHEDFIICAKWDANFAPERQIIIDANLGIKVSLKLNNYNSLI